MVGVVMVFTLLKTPCLFEPIIAKGEKMDNLNSYIVPGIIGVIGMVILYFMYKDMLKCQAQSKNVPKRSGNMYHSATLI